jgi:signal transduction histidine kinase
MTEAARLEEALDDAERERFDLRDVVAGCVEGYRVAYPQRPFAYQASGEPLVVEGVPEIVAQMLDKLVENAVDFATGGAIEVALARDGDQRA